MAFTTNIKQSDGTPPEKRGRGQRLRPRHQDEIKAKIQATQILKLIQSHVLNGDEIAQSRIHAGLKLLDKVMANAIAPAVEANQQAQAIQAINQAQLALMAQEMLAAQGIKTGNTINQTNDSVQLIESKEHDIQCLPERQCQSGLAAITPPETLG